MDDVDVVCLLPHGTQSFQGLRVGKAPEQQRVREYHGVGCRQLGAETYRRRMTDQHMGVFGVLEVRQDGGTFLPCDATVYECRRVPCGLNLFGEHTHTGDVGTEDDDLAIRLGNGIEYHLRPRSMVEFDGLAVTTLDDSEIYLHETLEKYPAIGCRDDFTIGHDGQGIHTQLVTMLLLFPGEFTTPHLFCDGRQVEDFGFLEPDCGLHRVEYGLARTGPCVLLPRQSAPFEHHEVSPCRLGRHR